MKVWECKGEECGKICHIGYPFRPHFCIHEDLKTFLWELVKTHQIFSKDEIERIKKDAVQEAIDKSAENSTLYVGDKMSVEEFAKSVCPAAKEPELMTFEQAWKNANIGDKVECVIKEKCTTDSITIKKGGESFKWIKMEYRYADSKNWQIIPAEPVVLSAEDMLCHMDDFDRNHEPDIIKYGERMDLNGQRRRDGDYRELKDLVSIGVGSHFSQTTKFDFDLFMHELSEALENLKPLEG